MLKNLLPPVDALEAYIASNHSEVFMDSGITNWRAVGDVQFHKRGAIFILDEDNGTVYEMNQIGQLYQIPIKKYTTATPVCVMANVADSLVLVHGDVTLVYSATTGVRLYPVIGEYNSVLSDLTGDCLLVYNDTSALLVVRQGRDVITRTLPPPTDEVKAVQLTGQGSTFTMEYWNSKLSTTTYRLNSLKSG